MEDKYQDASALTSTFRFEVFGRVSTLLSAEDMTKRLDWLRRALREGLCVEPAVEFDPIRRRLVVDMGMEAIDRFDALSNVLSEVELSVEDASGSVGQLPNSSPTGINADWILDLDSFRPVPPRH